MDEARVLARLDRIDELKHESSGARLRPSFWRSCRWSCGLCSAKPRRRPAEQDEAKNGTEEVVGRLRTALARDIIGM